MNCFKPTKEEIISRYEDQIKYFEGRIKEVRERINQLKCQEEIV